MHGAQRAATLTKRLLAFSRQQPLNPTALDVNRLLNGLVRFPEACTRRRSLAGDRRALAASGQSKPIAAELEAVILNLAINARDAMHGWRQADYRGQQFVISTKLIANGTPMSCPGNMCRSAVTDTGSGMTKEVVDRAFEPFFTTKQSGQGTGLGLSQVYGFVKQSGGHVKIYSEVGEGTTIKIYLRRFIGRAPAQEQIRSEAEPRAVRRMHPGRGGRRRRPRLCRRDAGRAWL